MTKKTSPLEYFLSLWILKANGEALHTPTGRLIPVIYQHKPAMLKIFGEESDEQLSGQALDTFGGKGAVRCLKRHDHALLIERCLPGAPLKELCCQGKDPEATDVFCQIFKKIHQTTKTQKGFPNIVDWGKGFDRYLTSGDKKIPQPLVLAGKDIFFQLAETQQQITLLHGDLHHDNILWDQNRGWLAIDPKGIIGEREIEVSAFLKNPVGHPEIYGDQRFFLKRVETIVTELNLNKERILKWTYALTILSCIWKREIDEDPTAWLDFARLIKGS